MVGIFPRGSLLLPLLTNTKLARGIRRLCNTCVIPLDSVAKLQIVRKNRQVQPRFKCVFTFSQARMMVSKASFREAKRRVISLRFGEVPHASPVSSPSTFRTSVRRAATHHHSRARHVPNATRPLPRRLHAKRNASRHRA